MDKQKEKALLGWVSGLTDVEAISSLKSIDYGACFISILQYMDVSATPEEFPSTEDRVLVVKKFLEDFYNISFFDDKLVNFSILSDGNVQADNEDEIAKVLLLLLCAGIQDKNSDILSAAMHVDVSLHWDVRKLIEAVVRPDEATTCLPSDFAKVFLEHSVSEMRDSPLQICIANLNLSNLNDSVQTSSPLRLAAPTPSPATPLEEFVNSPKLARKIMRREKEQKYKLERQLKEKERRVNKLQHDLRTEIHLREELELDLQESNALLERKDCSIRDLQQQVQRMRSLQDRLDELGALQDSKLELERDVESLRDRAQNAETMKKYCQMLRDENKVLYEDISNLRDKLSSVDAAQSEASKAHLMSQKFKVRVAELEAQLQTLRDAMDKTMEEKTALEADMDILRAVNQQQRQQLTERSASVGDYSGMGESMGVVTDILMEELRAEYDQVRNTWIPPEVHTVTLQDLEAATAALKNLEETSERKLEAKVRELQQLMEEVKMLKDSVQQETEENKKLQAAITDKDVCLERALAEIGLLKAQLAEKEEQSQSERQHLEEEATSLEEAKQDLENRIVALDQIIESLNATIADLRHQLDKTNVEKETAERKLEAKVAELQQLMEEVKMLKDSVQQETEEKNRLQAIITDKDVWLERAVADTDRLKTQLAEKEEQWQLQQQHLEDEVCRMEKEVTSLEEVKRDLDNRIIASDQTIESHNAVIADLRLQLDNTNMEKETAERKLEAKVTELQQLMEEVKMLKDSVQQETEEKKKLQAVITDKDVCLEKAMADTDCLKAQLAEKEELWQSQKQHLEDEVCRLEKEVMSLEEVKRDLDSRIIASDQTLQSHNAVIADLRLQLDNTNMEKETAERKLEAKVRELQQVVEEVKMLKDSVQQETEEKNKLLATITDKDVCLEKALADTDRLKTQLAEKEEQWQSQQQHLEDEVCRLEKEMTSLEEAKRDLDSRIIASDQTLQSHNAVIADLRLQLDNSSMEKETAERKLEAKVAELQQLMEEVKMLKDSVQQETEEKNKLLATITDKDVCLERALADTDHLKAQLAEKEEQLQQLVEEVKMLKDSVQQKTEEKNKLQATITDKDVCLERALANTDRLKAQLAEKEEQWQSQQQHLEDEMCRLEKEVTFLEEVKRDLDNRIAAFNQAIESNNATITDLRLQLDNTSMEKETAERKLEAKVSELQQLMEEVKMLKDSVQRETEEKNKLLAVIMDKDVCLEKAVADTDHLKAQLAEKEEQWQSERQNLEDEVCRLEKEVTSLEEARQDLDSRQVASDQTLQSHNAAIADLRLQLDSTNMEKETAERKLEAKVTELQQVVEEVKMLKDSVQQETEEKNRLLATITNKDVCLEKAVADTDHLKAQLAEKEEQWQSQQQHLEDEVCRLEKEVTSLEEAKRDLDSRQVASDQTLQSHNAVIADLRLQLDKERETAERKLEAKVTELQQLMEEVKMLKDSVQQETEEKNKLLAAIADKDVCLERAVADTDCLKAQLAKKEEQSQLERQHLEDEVCRLEKEVTSLEEAKRDLDSRQVASDQTLQSHNAVIADLRLQLDSINMEKETSEKKLEAKVAELQQLMEEVKMLKDSVQQETEEKNRLLATITDKDVCLEKAVADTDRLKAQLAEKEEQWQSERQHLKDEVCRLEKEVMSLEEVKRDLDSRIIVSDQTLQSHNAVIADLRLQLDNTNTEKETAECKLEAKVTELQATIANKDLCLERALADVDLLRAQLAEKEEQWQTQQQHLEDAVCRLETEVTALEEVKCDLDNRKAASDQTLQSHSAVIADLTLQLDNTNMEKETAVCELEAKVTELQATITNKELCLERALADADHLKAQLAKKEEQWQSERQHLEDEVCRLEKEVTSLEEAQRDLDNRQVVSDQTLQSHNATIADLRLQLDNTNMEKEMAERKLEAKVSELQQLQATIMEKDLRLEGAGADAECLKAQMAEKEEQWQSERRHLEDEVCRLEKEVTSLEEVKGDLDSRVIASDQTLQSHNAVIADLRLQLDNTNTEKDAAQRMLEAKVSELQQVRSTILDKDLHLEGALADADRLKALLAEQKEQWQSERQHLEDEVCRLEKEVTSLEEVRRDLDSRQVASDQTLQSHNAVIADLRLQLDNTNMEKETAERKLEAKATELQQLRVTIMEKDLCLERALANAERLKAQHVENEHQWQSHRQHLEDEVCRLEKEVTSLEEVKRDLDSRIIVSDQTLQSHNAVIADLRLQLDNTNMEKETAERKLEAKVTELQQLMEEVKVLKDSVQQETEEKNKLQAVITDKDVCLERALADTDRLKTQLAEKEEQESVRTTEEVLTTKHFHHYNLRSDTQLNLDGSFTTMLPQTPGAAEKQLLSVFDPNSSGLSQKSGRLSLYSVGSAKSNVLIPCGTGKMFSCEDEPPESPKFEWGRLYELQRRNTLCLPHMKTSYPIETQVVKDQNFDDDAMQQARYSDVYGKPLSTASSAISRKRKPETMEVDESPFLQAGQSDSKSSNKLARHGPVYQKPGPPTPVNDHRRQSGRFTGEGTRPSTPKRTPRRSPRLRSTPRHASAENLPQDPRRESIAFSVGFSPAKTGGLRRLTRQKAFISKSKLPQYPKPGDSAAMPAPSSSAPTSSKVKGSVNGKPPQPSESKGMRKPLGTRNYLQTPL